MATVKSAIRECRDQLYLDRADGKYLNNVTNNIGMERPLIGFSDDDLWRAITRLLALDIKLVETVFHRILELMLGPRVTAVSALAQNAASLDESIYISDQMNIPQLGTLILDPGTADEETRAYSFRDPLTGEVLLDTPLANDHTAWVDNASNSIITDYSAGVTSIVLISTDEFPEPSGGAEVPIIIGAGTDNEEVVLMTNNSKSTSTLTVSTTANAHDGPVVSFVTSELISVVPAGNIITLDEVDNFPDEGYIRITENGGATTEDVYYTSRDVDNDQLVLSKRLTNTYTTAYVNLLRYGETVQVAQVKVDGADWDTWQTGDRQLKIQVPAILQRNRLLDATFLHDTQQTVTPTTVATASSIGDYSLELAAADTFPESGTVVIDSGGASEEHIKYTRITRFASFLFANDTTSPVLGIPAGSTELLVDNAAVLYAAYTGLSIDTAIIDRAGTAETVTITAFDVENNTITLSTGLTNAFSSGDTIEMGNPDVLHFGRALEIAHLIGESVDLYQPVYAGTSLEDGRIFSATDHLYQGSYLYDLSDRLKYILSTTLAENLAGPQDLLVGQRATRTAVEVKDASLYNTTDLQRLQLGRGFGNREIVDINAVTLRRTIGVLTLASPVTAGDTTMTVSAGTLPDAFGYRLFIDDNTTGGNVEEIVIVRDVSGTSVTLEDGFANSHSAADNIWLLADVITTDSLAYDHTGLIKYDSRKALVPGEGDDWATASSTYETNNRVSPVDEVRDYIKVTSAGSFEPTGGYAILNFGFATLPAESRIATAASAGAGTLTLDDGSAFPATNFFVYIGVGARTLESIEVTSRAGNVLTLSSNILFDHEEGEWVQYRAGAQETLVYSETSTGQLEFENGVVLANDHMSGEAAMYSTQVAKPSTLGNDYPFYLPSDLQDRLEFVLDLARAAGVEIIFISDL